VIITTEYLILPSKSNDLSDLGFVEGIIRCYTSLVAFNFAICILIANRIKVIIISKETLIKDRIMIKSLDYDRFLLPEKATI
jgi:hypothetical protein